MSLDAMLDDLPKVCDRGTKKNARGIRETWRGYKLHIDTADCGVPLSAILTSLHDSQVAIPHHNGRSRTSTTLWTVPMTRRRYTRSANASVMSRSLPPTPAATRPSRTT